MEVFIKKINATVSVDWSALPAQVQAHLIEYGVRQKLADSLSDMAVAKGHSVEEMAFAVGELIARLQSGEVTARAGRTGDPIAREALAIATRRVKAAYAKATREWKDRMQAKGFDPTQHGDRVKFLASVAKALADTPAIQVEAKAAVAARPEAEPIDLDEIM